MKRSKIKVFQVGYNKCGTSSMYQFFKQNDYSAIHHKGKTDGTIVDNLSKGNNFLDGLDMYDIFTDSDYITREFALLEHLYPTAKFIYNVRPLDAWIKSRVNHGMGKRPGLPWFKKRYNIQNNKQLESFCWSEFKLHNDRINNHFVGVKAKKLLTFDIERDNVKKLIDFLPEFEFIKQPNFPKVNVGANKNEKLDRNANIIKN